MTSEIVYGDSMSQISVHKEGPIVNVWFVTLGEKPQVFSMNDTLYTEMINKMVKIANRE